MSSNVSQILASTKTEVASVLTAYSELPHGYIVNDNDATTATTGYQVLPLDIVNAEEQNTNRNYTVNQGYEIIITDAYTEPDGDDSSKRSKVVSLMDIHNDVYNKLVGGRCGIPSIVLRVSGIVIDEPVFNEEKFLVEIRMRYVVTYRYAINFS